MIPLPVVAAILGAFVLLVGPGEWFVLGWLRRRRWTWFTFPLLATAFALIAVRAAEHYLGREDKRAALIVTDVGEEGRILSPRAEPSQTCLARPGPRRRRQEGSWLTLNVSIHIR